MNGKDYFISEKRLGTLYLDKNLISRSNIFYIQIFDTNNKNVGKTKSTFINENELVYSFISKVEYEDEVTQIKEEFSTEGLNLDTGVYFLNIFRRFKYFNFLIEVFPKSLQSC